MKNEWTDLAAYKAELAAEYDQKVKDIKGYIVGKVDLYLQVVMNELQDHGEQGLADLLAEWRRQMSPAQIVEAALAYEKKPETSKEQT